MVGCLCASERERSRVQRFTVHSNDECSPSSQAWEQYNKPDVTKGGLGTWCSLCGSPSKVVLSSSLGHESFHFVPCIPPFFLGCFGLFIYDWQGFHHHFIWVHGPFKVHLLLQKVSHHLYIQEAAKGWKKYYHSCAGSFVHLKQYQKQSSHYKIRGGGLQLFTSPSNSSIHTIATDSNCLHNNWTTSF